MGKRIVFVGAGAVGGHVGGHLARTGQDVTFIDPWPEHVEHMKANGLELFGLTDAERHTIAVKAMHLCEVQSLVQHPPFDIAFVCVKAYDTAWATMLIKPYLAPDGFVVSLQNCINEETIAEIIGWGRTVGCIASLIAVDLFKPGHIQRNVPLGGDRHTVFRIGEPHGRPTDRVAEIAQMLTAADSSKVTTNLWGERWSKLVANSMRNGLSAATGLTGASGDQQDIPRRLAIRLAGEAVLVGQAHGYQLEKIYGLDPDDLAGAVQGNNQAMDTVEKFLLARASNAATGNHRPSMGQDIVKGRRTEIEYLNGFVCRKGREVGIHTPANEGMVELVKRVERGEIEPHVDNINRI